MLAVSAIFIDTDSNACSHCYSYVGILCSGLPGCLGQGQGGRQGQNGGQLVRG